MLFNSDAFIFVVLPVTLLLFFAAGWLNARLAAAVLGVASIVFYAWWSPKLVALLLASIVVNYAAGVGLVRLKARDGGASAAKWLLIAAVTADLALLAFFKYANFFITTVNQAGAGWTLLDIVL